MEGSAVHSDLFAHLGDLFAVVGGEDVQLEDAFGDIGGADDIDLEDFGLKMSFIRSVVLESFKKESSAFLDLVELQEDVSDLIDVCFWWTIVSVGHHLCQADSSLGIDWHNLSQN